MKTNESTTSEKQDLTAEDQARLGRNVDTQPATGPRDKSRVLIGDFRTMAVVAVCFIAITAGLALAGYLLKFIWVALLPVILAILVSTVLFPVTRKLRGWKFPRAAAAAATILAFLVFILGTLTAMGPIVAAQGPKLVDQAEDGFNATLDLIKSLPFDIQTDQVQSIIEDATTFLKNQASNIASGVITGVSAASSVMVAMVLMLVVSFFILKDGDRFLPWLRKYTGNSVGWHATELSSRLWRTLSGYIQAQAAVAAVDAVLIGLGLWALQVPLAFVIGVVTFFASFIPIVGAVVAGAIAVVIALVTNGLTNALLALALILLVQQIEGNVLQPILQSKAMGLHASIVLLAVTVGSTLAGIVGAFLAVPVAASVAVVLRYHAEMAALRAGEIDVADIDIAAAGEQRSKVQELYEKLSPVSLKKNAEATPAPEPAS